MLTFIRKTGLTQLARNTVFCLSSLGLGLGFFVFLCFSPIHQALADELDVSESFPTLTAEDPDPPQAPEEKKPEEKNPVDTQVLAQVLAQVLPEDAPPVLTPLLYRLFDRFNRNADWRGYIRNETAFRIVSPTALTKILTIIQLEARPQLSRRSSLWARGQCFYDTVYDIESVDVINPRKGPDVILEEDLPAELVAALNADNVRGVEIVKNRCKINALFLDLKYRHVDVRLGKQIVRWGVVEGARVIDEINPLDFYELILRNIDDRYISLFMLKTDLYLGPNTFEALFIPEVRGHRPAPRGTQWEQFRFLPGLVKPFHAWQGFPDHLENAEYAFRYTRVFEGLELSGSYFYTWDDFPAAFRSITREGVLNSQVIVGFDSQYTRLKIYGLSVAKTFSRFIINAEITYVLDKFFGARNIEDGQDANRGVIQSDYIKYALGFDLYVFGMDISPAAIQQYILDYDDRIIVKRLDTVGAVFIQKELIHNIWKLNFLLLYFVNDDNWLIRPRTYYNITDRIRLSFGLDLFEGKIGTGRPGEFNFIGFFDNNDRIFWDMTYSF